MKKSITLVFVLAMLTVFFNTAQSQYIRLNGYAFYTLDDNVESTNGNNYFNGTIKGNLLWGLGLEYKPLRDYGIELIYFRQDTDFPASYYDGDYHARTFKLGSNFILVGGNRYLRIRNSRIEPFAGGMIGLAIFENKEPLPGAPSSTSKLGWGIKTGVNIMASEQVGFKLQMQLLSAVQAVGGGLYLGTGGAGAGLGAYSTMMQVSFGGGLVIKFGKNPAGF